MNIRVTIESESRGNAKAMLERILRDFAKVKAAEATVKVGFPAGKAASDIIAIAVYNHEGTSRGIPPRPFITRALYQARGELKSFMRAEARGILTGKISVAQALPRLGIWAQGKIQKQNGSNMPPPNAPSTVRQKGSSKTLIDTGRMRQSVTWAVG